MAGSQRGCDVVERTPHRTHHGAIHAGPGRVSLAGRPTSAGLVRGLPVTGRKGPWGDARQAALGGAFSEDLVQDDGVEPVTQPYLSLLRCCC